MSSAVDRLKAQRDRVAPLMTKAMSKNPDDFMTLTETELLDLNRWGHIVIGLEDELLALWEAAQAETYGAGGDVKPALDALNAKAAEVLGVE